MTFDVYTCYSSLYFNQTKRSRSLEALSRPLPNDASICCDAGESSIASGWVCVPLVLAWNAPSLQSTTASISLVFDFLGLAVLGFGHAENPWGRMDFCFLAAGQPHTRSLRQFVVYRPGSVSRRLACSSLVNIPSSATLRPRLVPAANGRVNVSPRGLGPPACKARLFAGFPRSRDTASRTRPREGEVRVATT
jgi:hypothetical protein